VAAGLDDPAQHEKLRAVLQRAAGLVEVSREACRRIDEIVRSLRSFARLDEAERKPANLHEGIDSTLPLVTHLLKNRVVVEREYGTLPPVDCHPSQINQVFLNILVNAAQAIEGQGIIRIKTRHDPLQGTAVVEIADSGCGIPPERIGRIFDPGFTTKGVGVGTGLGLAISYRIVKQHRGRIDVDSVVGQGTTFRIILPTGSDAPAR
jgi:two-component system NtrC family sensor kinase